MSPGTGIKRSRRRPTRGREVGRNDGGATRSVRGNRVGAGRDRGNPRGPAEGPPRARAVGTAPGLARGGGAPRARRAAGGRRGPGRPAERRSKPAGGGRRLPADAHPGRLFQQGVRQPLQLGHGPDRHGPVEHELLRLGGREHRPVRRLPPLPDTTRLRAEVLDSSPQVQQAAAQVRAARSLVTVARSQYWPTLSASYSNGYTGLDAPWSTTDSYVNNWSLRFSLSWTLFNGF